MPGSNDTIDDRTLVITRVFEAPRRLVFEACTQTRHLSRWCAPHGFTITHCEGDLRPGGAWRCCMRSPEGVDHWVGGVYREIVDGERVSFTHAWDDDSGERGHETVVTITLAEERGRTRLTLHQAIFASVESRDGHRGGWDQCLDKLGLLLADSAGTEDAA